MGPLHVAQAVGLVDRLIMPEQVDATMCTRCNGAIICFECMKELSIGDAEHEMD